VIGGQVRRPVAVDRVAAEPDRLPNAVPEAECAGACGCGSVPHALTTSPQPGPAGSGSSAATVTEADATGSTAAGTATVRPDDGATARAATD
jgi:hypothetical protein